MKIEINANKRELQGTGASRRLRRAGKVPGILYGGETAAQPIEVDHNALFHSLRQEAFHASILTMNLDGQKQQVLLRDYQMHAYKPQVLHIDFQRVAADRKIHMKVPLHFVNADIAPGVKLQGGVVSHVLNELNISCLPADLPEFIEVDMKDVSVGHSIHVKDIGLPKGVEAMLHRNENPVVATITVPRGTTEAELAAGEQAAAATAAPAAAAAPAAGAAPAKQPEKK
ncbi:MAG: 50S ribosomal protein L25 [Rhodocyclaceae bacterium]|jgi:large subunit ribosomal protein L25|uniref:Large ribosomal subunit protein bL25 n=1 Tax=Candidatus Desulfobacillus denitrificans TaxID=2608985 RepID=A0A809S8I1_9PROT|nr:50S ribosomal protein L25/general stress protein Ctc [Rhodocyclaceae bacterium]OQY75043.1 MAG: 50S ribosomal protein L25/general stress protein Ctc [Rhodocyclaceae bacterium UTPRO2]BBO19614.1 50S ribosomal protein L25/general stress protein Ctc [Candidatus Desulfobacillus denitrificans]GIK45708.1 MAG: 50S ribosomal protein L25 [Betaproteobacteria bacterium]MCL4723526.1 50S ribosomal protein L25/general stress protein Ctc [Rhodocyclaceae bacterium]